MLYISDEPHFSRSNVVQQMKACCAMIHEVDPKIPIYSSTWRHCPEWNDSLDVWGIGHYGCFPVDEMKARVKAGSRFWWTTDGQMDDGRADVHGHAVLRGGASAAALRARVRR